MSFNQLQRAFNISEKFSAESGASIFVPRHNRSEFIASRVLNTVCSLAQDFSFDLAPHVLPSGCASFAGIQGGAPALNFSGPRCFDIRRLSLSAYVQALDQPGCDFRAFLLRKSQRILQDSVCHSSHKTNYSIGSEANQTASGDAPMSLTAHFWGARLSA
jgi:hypothetical protein